MQLSNDKLHVSDNIFFSDDENSSSASELSAGTNEVIASAKPIDNNQPVDVSYKKFDFSSLAKVSDIDIPFFNRLSDLLSVIFPQQVQERFNIRTEAESLKSRVLTYSNFIQTLADDSLVVQSQCLNWNSNFLMTFSRSAINYGLNEYLNQGSSQPVTAIKPTRVAKPLSRMGEQFAQSVANCCFTSINQILSEHTSLNMLTRYVENNIDKAVLVDGREKVVVCTINVAFAEHNTRPMNIVIPLSALGPFLPELDRLSNALAGQLEEPNNGPRISDSVQQVQLDLVATTGFEQVPLNTIANLKVGDILPLANFKQLHLTVLDDVVFKASLGNDGAFHAARIENVTYKAKQKVEG